MVLDDALLTDPRALAGVDTAGVLRSSATAGAQVRSAAEGALEAGVDRLAGTRPRALLLLRRPGASRAAADLLLAQLGPSTPMPVVPVDTVPTWVGPLDVLVAHTADATDAELADGIGLAVRRGAEVVLSAPGDGPVASAGAGRVRLVEPRVRVPAGLDLPQALTVGLATLSALDLFDAPLRGGLEPLADQLDAEAERNQPGNEPFLNPAKSLALRLAEHVPLLWGVDRLAAAAAGHAADALAVHAGVVAHADFLPAAAAATGLVAELNRGGGEADIFRDPFDDPDGPAALPPRLVLLATGEEDPGQVSLRLTGRMWPAADLVHPVDEVPRETPHAPLLRAAVLASRLVAAAIYLGLATRTIEPA
jgi:hypothetical protein